MAGLADLYRSRESDAEDRFERATLREAVIDSDPADISEAVFAIVPGFADDLRYGPCPWEPRLVDDHEYGTPSTGDRALVAISDEGEAWVVAWWPY
jgi:hypothetical protein